MPKNIRPGDCVKLPVDRIARVRDAVKATSRVLVRRKTSETHQFLRFRADELRNVGCTTKWMSPAGYDRYLKVTLDKMRKRTRKARS